MANRGRDTRMEKEWFGLNGQATDLTAAGTTVGPNTAFTESVTLIRFLIGWALSPTAVTTSQDAVKITLGLAKVSTDAAAAGAASMPDPADEPEFPWLYWSSRHFRWSAATSGTAGQGAQDAMGSVRVHDDLRTMRKFKPGQSLIWVVQYTDINGTPPVSLILEQTRILAALH